MNTKFNNSFDSVAFDSRHFYNPTKNTLAGLIPYKEENKLRSPHQKPMSNRTAEHFKPNFNSFSTQDLYKNPNAKLEFNYSSKNIPSVQENPKSPVKENKYEIQVNEKAFSFPSSPSTSRMQFHNILDKRTDTSSKVEKKDLKDETAPSWTKYISLELKCEEMEKNLTLQQSRAKQKTAKIQQLQGTLKKINQQYENKIQGIKEDYQKKLWDQKNDYQTKLVKKTKKIDELVEKLMDETKNCLSEEIKAYIQEVINSYTELKSNAEEALEKKEEYKMKIEVLENENKDYYEKIIKLENSVTKISTQLSQATQRFTSRSGTVIENNTFIQVLQAQAIQIDELRTVIEIMNAEQLKLRQAEIEAVNKLIAYQQSTSQTEKKSKSQQNKIISNLGLELTKKVNENDFLRRKLTNTESMLKNALEENKRKNGQLAAISTLPISEVPVSVKNKIAEISSRDTKLSICDQGHEEEIRKLRKRIDLLQN